jgi:hypothetical protein
MLPKLVRVVLVVCVVIVHFNLFQWGEEDPGGNFRLLL